MIEIGAYEAKTHLAEFLRRVKAGGVFRITQRGEAVADLVPVRTPEREGADAARRMQVFMKEQPQVPDVDLKALIEAGRD